MKNIIVLLMTLFLGACSSEESYIYYSYKKTTITRVDRGNRISFYYGKYKKDEPLPQSYIEETYSGFDGGMDAFLIVKDDGKVEIVPVGGLFKTINSKDNLFLNEFSSNLEYINWEKSVKGDYLNVCRVSNVLKVEIRLNRENNSKVKAVYP
ncbi:hypothetical protein [Flavobacterium tructae]|uniref:hypothetical protein n=1 Tax=Flavobacterium tructae TaxID=1114873 RepID=UPI0035A84644